MQNCGAKLKTMRLSDYNRPIAICQFAKTLSRSTVFTFPQRFLIKHEGTKIKTKIFKNLTKISGLSILPHAESGIERSFLLITLRTLFTLREEYYLIRHEGCQFEAEPLRAISR